MNRHGLWLGILALVAMLAAPADAQVRSPWLQVGVPQPGLARRRQLWRGTI